MVSNLFSHVFIRVFNGVLEFSVSGRSFNSVLNFSPCFQLALHFVCGFNSVSDFLNDFTLVFHQFCVSFLGTAI